MNYKYFKLHHWKHFHLHFSSWEGLKGQLGQAGSTHLLRGQHLRQRRYRELLTLGFWVSAQLFIPPARTACLLMTGILSCGPSWPGPLRHVPVPWCLPTQWHFDQLWLAGGESHPTASHGGTGVLGPVGIECLNFPLLCKQLIMTEVCFVFDICLSSKYWVVYFTVTYQELSNSPYKALNT